MVFKIDAGDLGAKTSVRKVWRENRHETQNQQQPEVNKKCLQKKSKGILQHQ